MHRAPWLVLLAACSSPPGEGPPAEGGDLPEARCVPPPRLVLDDIPDEPSLSAYPGALLASFEVDGDQLVGKHVVDPEAAEGALGLWQELVLRVPANQRAQLVQFTLVEHPELAAWVDNTGTANQTGRYGPSLYVEAGNLDANDPDPCAPLSGRRGTWDWTLIHELGHLRQYADGVVDDFVETFGNLTGDGEGYPEDGTPRLDGLWVSSYAERAGGDEDAAESFTAFVMLDPLPEPSTVAAAKVDFFDTLPDYPELRRALRVSEPGGGGAVPAAPLRSYDLEIDNAPWMWGTWEGVGPHGPVRYRIDVDDLVVGEVIDGELVELDYAHLRDDGRLAVIDVVESTEAFHYHQVSIAGSGYSESFFLDGETMRVEREAWGEATLTRAGGATGRR